MKNGLHSGGLNPQHESSALTTRPQQIYPPWNLLKEDFHTIFMICFDSKYCMAIGLSSVSLKNTLFWPFVIKLSYHLNQCFSTDGSQPGNRS